MTEPTIERLFSAPDLSGATPAQLRFSPGGTRVTYLENADDDQERLDLWQYDVASGTRSRLVDARDLETARILSDEEKARRERLRITHRGIVEYHWHPNGNSILFPLEGRLYLYDLSRGSSEALTTGESHQTDVRFSPDGERLAFVRGGDIYVLDLASKTESQLTSDGGGTVTNGLAEFIAQEEMHRFEGYWWSPDSQAIAFTRVDESPVDITQRYEIDADDFQVFDQRYPFAGSANASVEVGVTDLDGNVTWLDVPREPDSYIARVSWFSDSKAVAIQVQSRDQQTLNLYRCKTDNDQHTCLRTETSDTWINLNNCFRSLSEDHILWCSEITGHAHLYLLDANGDAPPVALTQGNWDVLDLIRVDEDDHHVYFHAYVDTPLEQHCYRVSLKGGTTPERLTEPGFTHQVELAKGGKHLIDRYSSPDQPPAVRLLDMSGRPVTDISDNKLDNAHPYFPYLDSRGDVEFGTLPASDGQDLYYRLIKPANMQGGEKYPVIVTVYGGPGVQRVTRDWVPPWHHYMASQGYGLLQLDNRGSANRGKAFEAPIYLKLGDVEVDDQLVGVDFLKSLPWVDGDQLGVFGHSYGGYMTIMLMAKASGIFSAGVSVAPVSDWMLYDTHYTERFLGHPDDNAEGYEASNVFGYLENFEGNLLLIHGMADDNVLFTHSTRLYKVFQDANVEFEMMTYPGAKHGLAGRKTNIHRYTLMDRFFSQHLKL